MQSASGELIRQIRRQYNLTQTELGGERFSKSYVSAVERNKIVPSPQALQYFAEQLGKPSDYFMNLFQQPQTIKQLAVLDPITLQNGERLGVQGEELALLDILLEDNELSSITGRQQLRALSPQMIAALPAARQARYHFLLGREAQEERNLKEALQAFERALALAPVELQVAILNELGLNYYLSRDYQTALAYHLRALQLWQQQREKLDSATDTLGFKIEFNCGNDYQALGAYRNACEHYENTRHYLNTEHDMKTAASLYYGLGYCAYGAIDQALSAPGGNDTPTEAIEHEYQRASSFLVQSRTLYQVGGDRQAEAQARLMQARVLLDLAERRGQLSREADRQKSFLMANCTALLAEAEEQCRQTLLSEAEVLAGNASTSYRQADMIIYLAFAFLIRVYVQRTVLASLGGYSDTSTRELMVATYLCNEVLSSFSKTELPLSLARDMSTLNLGVVQQTAILGELMKALPEGAAEQHSPFCVVEVCLAASEVAEQLGYAARVEKNASEWYEHANRWLQAGLVRVRAVVQSGERDYGYLAHSYRRCFNMLDERMAVAPEVTEQTTRTLVNMLKEAVYQFSYPLLYMEEAGNS
jgi:transcriptional regulator with XRE-family HTH domain